MIRSPTDLMWFFAAVVALFGLVIFLGEKFRARQNAALRELRASDAWALFAAGSWNFADFLYGVWQDSSMTQVSLLVKDSHEHEVGMIALRDAASRFSIDAAGEPFFALRIRDGRERWELWPSTPGLKPLCSVERIASGVHHFKLPNGATMNARFARWQQLKSCEYEMDGRTIGECRQLSGSFNKGAVIVLPRNLPLAIRLFVLAVFAPSSVIG
jgi:hypothetical protein